MFALATDTKNNFLVIFSSLLVFLNTQAYVLPTYLLLAKF